MFWSVGSCLAALRMSWGAYREPGRRQVLWEFLGVVQISAGKGNPGEMGPASITFATTIS